jgi:nucleotide-binding universal stress UspA family protein
MALLPLRRPGHAGSVTREALGGAVTAPAHPARRPIIVGVDGSAAARAALRFAFAEGLERRAPVTVVTTWMLGFTPRDAAAPRIHRDGAVQARQIQDEQISLVLDDLEQAPEFTQVIVNDVSGPALIDSARNAALLVVGTGGQNPLSPAFLGPVGEFCVRHSTVPVAIVRAAAAGSWV